MMQNVTMKGLTDITGIRVGHASDFEAITGCTVVLCERGAVAGVEVRGAASGTRELDALSPFHIAERIQGVLISGGSAFGLEAASGVMRYLEERGAGFDVGPTRVPIVPAVVIYDLSIGDWRARPTAEMGYEAARRATRDKVAEGSVGAGTGATVGKLRYLAQAMKGGLGTATIPLPGGVLVSALVVVNAFGDVIDPRTGKILAGARRSRRSRAFLDTAAQLLRGAKRTGFASANTTVAVVATNARLDRVQATLLARMAQVGLARVIRPVHTRFDGDTVFALSLGRPPRRADPTALGVAAGDAVAASVLRAIKTARSLGDVPSWRDFRA